LVVIAAQFSSYVAISNEADFRSRFDHLNTSTALTVILEFGASWCKNCKKIAPTIKLLAEEYMGQVIVLDVDIDDCEEIASEFDVSTIPR
jgi:thioredoxin 1